MLLIIALATAACAQTAAPSENLVPTWDQWQVWPPDAPVYRIEGEDLVIDVPETQEVGWYQYFRSLPCAPGERFTASVDLSGDTLRDGAGPAITLCFSDAAGQRLTHADQYCGPGFRGPRRIDIIGQAPAGAAEARVAVLLHGHGVARFKNPELRRAHTAPAEAPDTATLTVTGETACAGLTGFGFEDDGWFYNQGNAEHGADARAVEIREGRIAWLDPDWVRMFFWYHDFCPSLDGETFTWDSDGMESHYRTLALYQRLGTRVNACGVEWGLPQCFDDPEKLARIVGALLQHVIVDKRFTCIRDWTLTNEPNLFYAHKNSFERFVELHQRAAAEFQTRGLDLNIVGSDDGDGQPWFAQCVETDAYFNLAGSFSSHFYLSQARVPCAGEIFAGRVATLHARTPEKPMIIGEFGIQDQRMKPPDKNPIMREYPFATQSMSCFIDGLNAGVAGFSTWCVQEVYYPGAQTPMEPGLWDFGGDWPVRPIYHAVGLFCRETEPGDAVQRVASSCADFVKGVVVGGKLFWVNLAPKPVKIRLEGAAPGTIHAYAELTLAGDRDTGVELTAESGAFDAPAASFGMAE